MSRSGLRIQTLGEFLIEYDGQVVESFLTRKTALLLVYLALNPGKHARETLAALLWADTTDEQALKNLRTVLSNLRDTVPNGLQISRQAVQIGDTGWIDARHFAEGCDALLAGEPTPLEKMLTLVDLYKGDFLREVYVRGADSFQEWIEHQRDRLHHTYEQLLYHIGTHCLEIGDAYTGVAIARQLVRLNPLWEAAQRQLMRLLVQLDQRGEAQIQYERVVSLLDAELGVSPDPETTSLYEQIKSGAIQPPRRAATPRIILPDVPYIPPLQEMTYLRERLDARDCRLLTLTGIGGQGKSMLATVIAHDRQSTYRDGAVIVPLAPLNSAAALPQVILSSLNVPVKGSASDQVIAELRTRQMLLVLDNYEHLLPDTALIARILDEAPDVQLLVTSQVALNLRQEWLLPLSGLKPDADGEAMHLFRATAERVLPHFDMSPYWEDVRQICALLDGLPLGIVIAAGQVRYQSPSDILAALRNNPLSLTTVYHNMPDRHRGFASLIEATLKYLSAEEKRALRALSIFRGSFQHEAALAIAEIDMNAFIRLVDKSLIQRVENFRYRIHSLLRQVFAEQLTASGEYDAVCERLTAYYVDWCRKLYRQKRGRDDDLPRIDHEHANIWHLDLLTAFEQGRYLLEIIPTLRLYWRNRGYAEQVAAILQPAFDDERHPADLRARGMVELASMLIASGQQNQGQALCERAIIADPDNLYVQVDAQQQLARLDMQRGDHQAAWSRLMTILELESSHIPSDDPLMDYLFIGNHNGMGLASLNLGEPEIARSHFNIAMNGWEQMGEPLLQAQVRNNLALLDLREGHYETARQHFEAIIPLAQAAGWDSSLVICVGNLGKALMLLGDYAAAHTRLSESLQMALRLKQKTSVLYQLETFAELAHRIEQTPIAAQLYGYLLKASEDNSIAFWPATATKMQDYINEMQTQLGPRYEQLTELGRKLSQDAVVALARSLAVYLPPSAE